MLARRSDDESTEARPARKLAALASKRPDSTTKAPPWPSKAACLRARLEVARREALATFPKTISWRLGSGHPASPRPVSVELAELGPRLLADLERFRTLVSARTPGAAAVGRISETVALVRLHAAAARREAQGTTVARPGRPGHPARNRVVAREVARVAGIVDKEATAWVPSVRDLALLSICEGASELPSGWEKMTVAALIRDEVRAMRHASATGKK